MVVQRLQLTRWVSVLTRIFATGVIAWGAQATPAQAAAVLEQIGAFTAAEANQGVGVDRDYFCAVDNAAIGKSDKRSGKRVKKWQGVKGGAIEHLDSAMVMDGRVCVAHSNYRKWPMTSSVEIFDAVTMEHMGRHSFGVQWGSLTWMDRHDRHWWMTFAKYDRLLGPNKTPYGHKANTVMVKFASDF